MVTKRNTYIYIKLVLILYADYIPNDDHLYVFTSETRELPIETRLQQDRAREGVEDFIICLPEQTLQMMGAEAVAPTCVSITIVDDDCKGFYIYIVYTTQLLHIFQPSHNFTMTPAVVIGFSDSNSSVILLEGGPTQTVCVDVKRYGLPIDPFDQVPLIIQTDRGAVHAIMIIYFI